MDYITQKLSMIKNSIKTKVICFNKETAEKRPQSQKSLLRSNPGEDGFCNFQTKHNRRAAPRPKFFDLVRILQEQRPQPRKISWI
jgi:hypothetical protein